MALPDPRTTESVIAAIAEYDAGAEEFHARHGFGRARVYHVRHGDKLYPSKAIAARAYGIEIGRPVPNDFPGGWAVASRLEKLGFEIYVDGSAAPPNRHVVQEIEVEAHVVDEYSIAPRPDAGEGRRDESDLVERFRNATGHPADFVRHTIVTPDGDGLVTDLYDKREHIVYEAKSSTHRTALRLALGQLLDYRRCLVAAGVVVAECRVLLPEAPPRDPLGLLLENGVGVVWPDGDGWHVEAADGSRTEF